MVGDEAWLPQCQSSTHKPEARGRGRADFEREFGQRAGQYNIECFTELLLISFPVQRMNLLDPNPAARSESQRHTFRAASPSASVGSPSLLLHTVCYEHRKGNSVTRDQPSPGQTGDQHLLR